MSTGIEKTKADLHLARKIWHMCAGCGIIFPYLFFFDKTGMFIYLSLLLSLYLSIECLRIYRPSFHLRLVQNWRWVLRKSEMQSMNTGIPFVFSSLITLLIFPKTIALLAMSYLFFGDPIASFFGVLYGRKKLQILPGKTWPGLLANFMTCGILSFIFLRGNLSPQQLFYIVPLGGFIGMSAEALPLKLDDNFTIPLFSAFCLNLTFVSFSIAPH